MERDIWINCSIWDKKCSIWDIGFCHNKHLSLSKIGIEFVLKFFNKKMGGAQQLLFSVKKCKKMYIDNTKTKKCRIVNSKKRE